MLCIGLVSSALFAQHQHPGAPEGFTAPEKQVPAVGQVHMQNATQERDGGFATTLFTFADIIVFSYFDNSVFEFYDASNNLLDTQTLDADSYYNYITGTGIYRVVCNNTFTVLVGDAITATVNGYFAVNESGRAVSTKLNTWMMSPFGSYDDFIVFAYENNTDFTVRNLETGNFIYGTSLNAGEYLSFRDINAVPYSTPLQVLSNKPVSALSYTDQDYYVPSDNGTFSGTLFYGFSGYAGGWANSITITSYHDNNEVTVYNTNTNEVIETMYLDEGQVASIPITSRVFWTVEAQQTVTAANIPFGTWSGNYYYLTKAVDLGGTGAGTLFYLPTIGSRVDVFSFADDNDVTIIKLGTYNDFPYTNPDTVWTGTLQNGESYNFNSPFGSLVYKIESETNVSVVQSNGGAGADFMALEYSFDLPDFSVSARDIEFSVPDTVYQPGDIIEITFRVHNFSPVPVPEVTCKVYEYDPDGGTPMPAHNTVVLTDFEANSNQTFTISYQIPDNPEYRSIYIKVDPDNEVPESNLSNNKAERTLRPNIDLLPPLAVNVTAPLYLVFIDDVLTPNPFPVQYDIFNNGTGDAINVEAELSLTGDLSSVSGETSWSLGNIPVNGTASINLDIEANPDAIGYHYYSLTFFADNAEVKTINRMVIVGDISLTEEKHPLLASIRTSPNPFKDEMNLSYTLRQNSHVLIKVFNAQGAWLETLIDQQQMAGEHQVQLKAVNLSSGLYYIYFEVDGQPAVRRVVLNQ